MVVQDVVAGELIGIDLVRHGCQIVSAEGEILSVGDDGLARGSETFQGSAQFLHVGQAAGVCAVGQIDELDVRILGSMVYGFDSVQNAQG